MLRRVTRRLADDRGFTLPELLISSTLGVGVILIAFTTLDTALKTQSDAAARIDSVQRGRESMNELGRIIRAQTCLGNGTPAITAATGNSLQLVTSIGGEQLNPGYQALQRRTITYDPSTYRITVDTVPGSGAPPATTFNGAATSRVIAEGVRLDGSTPMFRYYALQGTPAQASLELLPGAGMSQANRARVVRIDVNFLVRSRDASGTSAFARYSGRYWVRTADPEDIAAGAGCQ